MSARRLLSINNYYYRRGGAEVVFLEHNRLLEGAGWQVTPFAMKHPRNLPTASEQYFVDEIEFGNSYGMLGNVSRGAKIIYSFEAKRKIRSLIDDRRPVIAHAHNIYHHISPSIFPELKAAGIPTVMTLHDLKLACPAYTMRSEGKVCELCKGGRIHNVLVNRCIKGSLALSGLVFVETAVHRMLGVYSRNVDRFVSPSRFLIEKLVEWGWPRERFAYIPNFVDAGAVVPQRGAGRGFLYFGRLAPEKGLDVLIRAAARANVKLALAGTGPEEGTLRALAEREGTEVRFLGHLGGDDLSRAISEARAVVMPSTWYENAPLMILEAYAHARPVVGSAIGGIQELIREGETGFFVPPSEVEPLADALARIASMPDDEVMRLGEAGRSWVEREFSPEVYRSRILELYQSLAGPLS